MKRDSSQQGNIIKSRKPLTPQYSYNISTSSFSEAFAADDTRVTFDSHLSFSNHAHGLCAYVTSG